ncbi:MAG: tripartite tricarboxylate transporter substrate-binding protein [Candidatus Hinthialibacter antarcticus]|nr:tripartite tricarboxylate transporter substrate-binding protein [Candidatus Hinthialibacter antarcticus]
MKSLGRMVLLALCVCVFFIGCAERESRFPSKPITIVVTWDAGGGTDALARSLAMHSSDAFGTVVNVLNRPGGSGAVGHSFGATARPDGYTVTMITYELCTYQPLGRVDLSPLNYKPVMQLNEDPAAITVHADSPWQTLAEFIEHAKQNPGAVTIGNSGPGAVWHIGALKIESETGVEFTHVPHNGAKPAVTQLLGKHIDAVSVSPAEVLQYLELGTLRCLGVMSDARFSSLPDVPTMREQGVELVHGTWRGLAAPPETPDAIIAQLKAGFKAGFDSAPFQESAKKALLGLRYRGPQEFKTFLGSEFEATSKLLSNNEALTQSGSEVNRFTVPLFYGGLLAFFCLVLFLRSMMTKTQCAPQEKNNNTLPAIVFLCIAVYAGMMFVVGYIISTLAFLALMLLLLGERRPLHVGAWSIGVTLIVYVIFKTVLDVPLPGVWGA